MKDAPHPYRHDDRPAKAVVRYWPLPGQRTASVLGLVVLIGLAAWSATRALTSVSHRLECTRIRPHDSVTCTYYEERPTKDPKVLWQVENITGVYGPLGAQGIPIRLAGAEDVLVTPSGEAVVVAAEDGTAPTVGTLRLGMLPITEPELAQKTIDLIKDPLATNMTDSEGGENIAWLVAPLFFAGWAIIVSLRLPRPVTFTIDAERGTLTVSFGSLARRHTTVMRLDEIDRADVVIGQHQLRRLHVIKKDGTNEIFEEEFRPLLHHHDVADQLNAAIARARRDVV